MELKKAAEIQSQKETIRIETFSDGVFCIAVTLLSIEIGVEVTNNETNAGLVQALLSMAYICGLYHKLRKCSAGMDRASWPI